MFRFNHHFKRISQNRIGKLFIITITAVALTIIFQNEKVKWLNMLKCGKMWFQGSFDIEDSFDLDRRGRSLTEKRKAFLLMAGYRGGSTLTGEMFNRNKNILYFFGNWFLNINSRTLSCQ